MYGFKIYFLLFISYSIIGWCLEVICKLVDTKRFINRGFLIGPYCPIYGWGAILITILLEKYTYDPLVLFIFAIIICSILEYLTSYVMEKIFYARWWDYSARIFNINGRICLGTMIPFGLLGLLMMYYINPFFINIFMTFSQSVLTYIVFILSTLFLADNIISIGILMTVRKDNRVLDKDNTEEMSKKVYDFIKSKGILYRRLFNAFPDVKHVGIIMKKAIDKKLSKLDFKKELVAQKREVELANIKYEYSKKIKKIERKTQKKLKKIQKHEQK